ncbi:fimbrial protein [Providencia rettgeri]
MSNKSKVKYWVIGLFWYVFASSAYANWLFDGYLIIPPVCQISHIDPLKVSFGKVGVRKVNGVAYKQPIPFELNCEGDMKQPWDISLIFSGSLAGSGFDDSTLRTISALNNGKLGIQIQRDGKPQPLNKPFLINQFDLPSLSAVPVMRAGSELVGDNFTASGTLTIMFE